MKPILPLVTTSGLNGPLGYALAQKNVDETAHNILERFSEYFGEDRLFLELQDFAVPNQPQLNDLARQMSDRMGQRQ